MDKSPFCIVVILLWTIISPLAAEDAAEIVHLSFDEVQDSVVPDLAGGDNRGTLHGSPPAAVVAGPIGPAALELKAANQHLSGPDVGLPVGTAPGTISLWFNRPDWISDKVLFCCGTPQGGRGRGIWLFDTDTLVFYKFSGGPLDLFADVPGGITPGRWHQVVATYDGKTARLYYDGREIGSLEGPYDTLAGGTYHVGANLGAEDGRDFVGLIDEVRVFSRALGADEIGQRYAKHAGGLSKFDVDWPAQLVRRISDLGVEEIVFAVRSVFNEHWYANFGYWATDPQRKMYGHGGRLCRLNLRSGKLQLLLDDPQGSIRDPQVHYEGRKILFSYRPGGEEHYHLYEISCEGSGLRQLTGGPYDDFEPAYLPDERIVFCSSRCRRWVPCWSTQVAVLHVCGPEGQDVRPLSSNIEQENTPCVLPDGRLLYTRWEYVDRSQVDYHHLWSINPDGTGVMIYYGNQHPGVVMIDAKPIPGTQKVVASFSPGHGKTEHMGAVTIVDPRAGPDQRGFTRRVSPGQDFRDPYPLSEDCFLVARGGSLLVMDGQGGLASLYDLPAADAKAGLWCHEPRPLGPRPRERAIPPRVDSARKTGRLILANVNHGRNMTGVKLGEIKKLLVLESLPEPVNFNGAYPYKVSFMEPITFGGTFALARVLGTVPVEPDGSAHFELPALRSLFFVALDENDLAVKRMQSFVTVQPGETTSCSGCHEQRTGTPPRVEGLLAMQGPPSRIQPFAEIHDVLDLARDIQPILDKHCVECHNPDRREGDVDLCSDRTPCYSVSYLTMVKRRLFVDGRNGGGNRRPRSIGSSASRIVELIDRQHYDVKLSPQERMQLILWIEAGAAYAGTYAAYFSGMVDVQFPVDAMTRRCGDCHAVKAGRHRLLPWEGNGDTRPWTSLPLEFGDEGPATTLCNLSRPEKSALLLAPLSAAAGGYGTCQGPVFAGTDDKDYQAMLGAITAAAAELKRIKRFDMPAYRPNEHYIREMQRYGVLPPDLAPKLPIDPYATDQTYWRSMWPGANRP